MGSGNRNSPVFRALHLRIVERWGDTMARSEKETTHVQTTYTRWSPARAFLLGAVIGSIIGIIRGWQFYGTIDAGYFYNHVLGGLFIGGIFFAIIVMLLNWIKKNPV